MSRVVLLEFGEQIDSVALGRDPPSRIIAVSPEALLDAEMAGITAAAIHTVVDSAAIQLELKDRWDLLDRIIGVIDEYAPYAATVAYSLKILLDSCSEKIIQLDEVIRACSPEEVHYPAPGRAHTDFLEFSEDESVYAALVPLVTAARGIRATVPLYLRLRSSGPNPRRAIRRWGARGLAVARSANSRSAGPSVLLVENGYGLDEALGHLTGHRVLRWAPHTVWDPRPLDIATELRHVVQTAQELPREKARFAHAWAQLVREPRLPALFSCRGISFLPVVRPRLERLFRRVFPALPILERAAGELLAAQCVKAVTSCYFSRPETMVVARAARRAGVPVITIQHSAYGYWHWPLAKYTDSVMSDVKVVGGPGAEAYVREHEHTACRPVSAGMIPIERLAVRRRLPQPRSRPLVVYPLASYIKNAIHYSNSRFAVTEYFEINRQVLRVLGGHRHVDVIVRLHPAAPFIGNAQPLVRWVTAQKWPHVRISTNDGTVALMQEASLVIIDSPSTVLLQAAATSARLLVFNRSFPFLSSAIVLLRKRAEYTEDLAEFLATLNDILGRRAFSNDRFRNDEFLRAFATDRHDGGAVRRTAEAITAAIGHAGDRLATT